MGIYFHPTRDTYGTRIRADRQYIRVAPNRRYISENNAGRAVGRGGSRRVAGYTSKRLHCQFTDAGAIRADGPGGRYTRHSPRAMGALVSLYPVYL